MLASTLHTYVESRFRELFGEPANALGKDIHWALRPRLNAMPINILLNGSATQAIVWVFDPYDHGSALREGIATKEAAEWMISQIQERLRLATGLNHPDRA
jgi:hypothetical protein